VQQNDPNVPLPAPPVFLLTLNDVLTAIKCCQNVDLSIGMWIMCNILCNFLIWSQLSIPLLLNVPATIIITQFCMSMVLLHKQQQQQIPKVTPQL
jgi:hypothetical protein